MMGAVARRTGLSTGFLGSAMSDFHLLWGWTFWPIAPHYSASEVMGIGESYSPSRVVLGFFVKSECYRVFAVILEKVKMCL